MSSEQGTLVQLRLPPGVVDALETYRRNQERIPPRTVAIMQLICRGLDQDALLLAYQDCLGEQIETDAVTQEAGG